MVMLVPFAYLGVCGWLLYRMTNDGFGGREQGPDAPSGTLMEAVGWDDVAGVPQAKAAVMEVVDALVSPARYAKLGARCPRGVLIAGPPGTGKTLLARAIASEAGVPFLSCTGSDFVEVFVGRGARRVRNLFDEATRRAPCVVFIDELDALGSARSRGGGGGCEEHDHALNQLLAQMDGIGSAANVLVIGATNRLSALDPALTRPGRFDRVLQLSLPDEASRLAILRVHAGRTPLARPEEVLPRVARATAGFSGAELANLVNEAAIGAARAGEARVSSEHYGEALRVYKESRVAKAGSDCVGLGGGGPDMANLDVNALFSSLLSGVSVQARAATGGGSSVEENE